MLRDLTAAEKGLILVVSALAFYLIAVGLGRWMKRAGVRLGMAYQLFAIAISLYLPLKIFQFDFTLGPLDLQRELKTAAILLGALFLAALTQRYLWEFYFHEKKRIEIPKFLRELAALLLFLIPL